MNITNRTVSFREGQSVSDHAIFEDADGVEFIAEPGPVQKWLKLADIKKPRHDRVRFLQDAARQTGLQSTPEVMAAAYAHQQRTVNPKPLKVIAPDGALVDNK